MTTPTRWTELYEAALKKIQRESRSPPGSMYDRDDRDSAKMIATLQLLVEERERGNSGASKLSEEDLRQAIRLGTQLAEEEALFKLTMKAKQVAELDRRWPRLIVNNTLH